MKISREGLPMTKKVILAITLLLAGLVAGVSSAEGSEAAPVYYVALGDSLATGARRAVGRQGDEQSNQSNDRRGCGQAVWASLVG